MGRSDSKPIFLGAESFGTLFNPDDPKRSPPGTLSVANNIKLEDGNLRGFPAPGAEDASASPSRMAAMAYIQGEGWIYANNHISLCHDSVCPWAPNQNRFSYRAFELGSSQAVASDGAGNRRRLGTPPPTITSLVNGAGGLRQVRLTVAPRMGDLDRSSWGTAKSDFYQHWATGESNPQQSNGGFGTAPASNNPWLEIPAWDGAVIGVGALAALAADLPLVDTSGEFEIRVYARAIGALAGPAKLIMRQAWVNPLAPTTVTISTANETTWGTNLILAWDVGGSPDAAIYKDDFSPAPLDLNTVSDEVHTVAATAGGTSAIVPPSAGILVGTTRSGLLCWSKLGYPWRWPIYARQRLEGDPLAVVTTQATTAIATNSSWYVLSGTDDYRMSLVRAEAEHFCADRFGASVVNTPKGIFFVAELGVAAFDGSRTVLLHRLVHPFYPQAFTHLYNYPVTGYMGWFGAYHEGYYFADIGSGAGIVLDLTQEGMPATMLANEDTLILPLFVGLTVRRLHCSRVYRGPGGDQGLPTLWANTGICVGPIDPTFPAERPHSWRPRVDQSNLNTVSRFLPWQATTQRIRSAVRPLRQKWWRLEQRVFNFPNPLALNDSFSAVAGRGDLPTSVLGPIGVADGLQRLPFGFDWVDWVQFYWKAGADTGAGGMTATAKQVDSAFLRGREYAAG